MKKILLSTVALFSLSAAGLAADLAPRSMAPPPLVAAVPVFTWTGFYLGIHAGGVWAEEDVIIGERLNVGFSNGAVPARLGFDNSGWMGGAQIGFNWQFGAFVAGIEADISGVDIGGTRSSFFPGSDIGLVTQVGPRQTSLQYEMDWLGTVRGRLGFAFDRWMIFGTGGFAFAESRLSGEIVRGTIGGLPNFVPNIGNVNNVFGRDSDTQSGWAAGAGVEYAFTNNITFKAEWLHYDLGDQNVRLSNALGDFANFEIKNEGDIFRIGANYKF